jgi:A/G-specific adenine glycosylase
MARSPRSSIQTGVRDAPTSTTLPIAAVDAALAAWFQVARRDLPWRRDRTAYRVWLSEVMLQQTQVSRVVDYFERFVARFPDVRDLAAAAEDEVLSLWSGLGYYSRGRNLHKAARVVVDEHDGRFPADAAGLASLPGVGAYTAAAIATFSAGERIAVVDGNVVRVLSRLVDCADPVDQPAGRRRLEAIADALVAQAEDPAVHNEAIMELGALVCTPKSPSCGACPWSSWCAARAAGTVSRRPLKARSQARKALRVACVVVEVDGRVHLERRDRGGLFRGLWEPICVELQDGDDAAAAWASLCVERGVAPPSAVSPIVVERTLTHRDLRFEIAAVTSTTAPRAPAGIEAGLFDDDALRSVGTASAIRAVLAAVRTPRLL